MLTPLLPPGARPAPPPIAPSAVPLDQLFAHLQTSATGLTSAEAIRRLAASGPNDLATTPRRSLVGQLVIAFLNPLVVILLAAAGVSAFVGEVLNAGIIVAMVVLGFALNCAAAPAVHCW